jgi:hypothetical protein
MGFWLKACPKCKGDVYEDCDWYGPYAACLQCGHSLHDFPHLARGRASPAPSQVPAGLTQGALPHPLDWLTSRGRTGQGELVLGG